MYIPPLITCFTWHVRIWCVFFVALPSSAAPQIAEILSRLPASTESRCGSACPVLSWVWPFGLGIPNFCVGRSKPGVSDSSKANSKEKKTSSITVKLQCCRISTSLHFVETGKWCGERCDQGACHIPQSALCLQVSAWRQ